MGKTTKYIRQAKAKVIGKSILPSRDYIITPPGGEGTSRKIGRGVRPASKTLTLFMTKIYDFPYSIYDLTQKLDTLFMTLEHSCRKNKFVKGFCCWLYLAGR